jgi:protein-tyrosine kinase
MHTPVAVLRKERDFTIPRKVNMSRIHDALKKAEQERNATDAFAATTTLPVSLDSSAAVGEVSMPVGRGESPAPPTSVVSPPAPRVRSGFDAILRQCARLEWHTEPNSNVFSKAEEGAHCAEQFRTLRSRLYQIRGELPNYTLLVTSSVQDEGKTFVVSNLAHAIVQQPNRRALIIDADLRYPQLHLAIGAPLLPGLTEYLGGKADENAIIQCGKAENLYFIPGGNHATNPSELLSNGRLKVLLDRLGPLFDWVILDSSPCLPVEDPSMLADLCNGVLFVLRAGSTPVEVAQKACKNLQGRNMVGVVLNGMEQAQLYGSDYYAYGYGANTNRSQGQQG